MTYNPDALKVGMRLLCLLALLCLPGRGVSQQSSILDEHYKLVSPKGLSSGTCYTTILDHDGFIWTSTRNGIDRYDGAHYRHYRLNGNVRRGLHDGMMIYLHLDTQGRIWVYTERSIVYRYNPDTDTFEQVLIFPVADEVGSLQSIYVHGDEVILAVSNGLMVYDMAQGGVRTANLLSGTAVRSFAPYKDGMLLVGTNKGLALYDLNTHRATTVYERFFADVRSIHYDPQRRRIWAGTHGQGLFLVDDSDNITQGKAVRVGPQHLVVYCIRPVNENECLVGTDGDGLLLLRTEGDDVECRLLASDTPEAKYPIHCSCVRDVLKEDNGRIWLSMHFGGVTLLQPADGILELNNPEMRCPADGYAFGASFDKEGRVWVAFNEAIGCFDREGNSLGLYLNHQARFLTVKPMDDGTVWCGGYNTGLYHFDPATGKQEFFSSVHGASTNDCVYALHVDPKGDLWVGGLDFGLTRIHYEPSRKIGDGIQSLQFDHCGISQVSCIAQLTDSVLALATSDGLYLYNTYNRRQEHYFLVKDDAEWQGTNFFSSLDTRHGHEVWLATDGAGLVFFDTQTHEIRSYGFEYGLPSLELRGIALVSDSVMCCSTEQAGIFSFNCARRHFLHTIYGISNNEVNAYQQNAIVADAEGRLIAGGDRGAVLVIPEKLNLLRSGAQIHVDGHQVVDGNITLPYSDRNLSLTFSTTDVPHQAEYHFLYRIHGIDSEWKHMDEYRHLEYLQMPSGHYTLEVMAIGAAAVMLQRTIGIEVERGWVYYLTRGLSVLFILAVLLGFHYYVSRKVKASKGRE